MEQLRVIDSAIKNKVKKIICLSTDKAAYPINAMGISKALMKKTAIASSRNITDDITKICGKINWTMGLRS